MQISACQFTLWQPRYDQRNSAKNVLWAATEDTEKPFYGMCRRTEPVHNRVMLALATAFNMMTNCHYMASNVHSPAAADQAG